jgi:hypothetical protein
MIMTPWLIVALVGIGIVSLGLILIAWFGSIKWSRQSSRLTSWLTVSIQSPESHMVSFDEISRLPTPVAKYLHLVLTDGRPVIRSAYIRWKGEFRVGSSGDKWGPFTAGQWYSVQPPGFVWDARIRMGPAVIARVRDAYVAAEASMQASIYGLLPVVDQHDRAELNAGALQRYLAETVYFPTALLPAQNLIWAPIDDHRALATLTDLETTVSLEFRFNDAGEIESVFTPERYREVNGRYEPTPWAGYFGQYEKHDEMLIPTDGRVEWQLPNKTLTYWKGRPLKIEYRF